ncbi:MAG: Radical SAM superfamily protein [Methanosaeta sp. PtaU1.Bin112]|nr:MAG: Radical SAM superfamily protein [Methanosaeta sp. PtaU1.Bin112]
MILRPFDPWKSELCTCPAKLSLNPYTGCPHGCLYCYASSYILRFAECRPKADLLRRLVRESSRISPGTLVSLSNSSDPYPPQEEGLRLSRGCLQILKERGLCAQVVTKSHLVARDADLLSEMKACVAITITSLSESICRKLEPGAPSPERRLDAMAKLSAKGVPISARIDPIIPGINDEEIDQLAAAVSRAGARHITSSTFKTRPGNMKKIISVFAQEGKALERLFSRGCKVAGSGYLPEEIRRDLMHRVNESARREKMTFSTCREGWAKVPGISCDGSHLLSAIGSNEHSLMHSPLFHTGDSTIKIKQRD